MIDAVVFFAIIRNFLDGQWNDVKFEILNCYRIFPR